MHPLNIFIILCSHQHQFHEQQSLTFAAGGIGLADWLAVVRASVHTKKRKFDINDNKLK